MTKLLFADVPHDLDVPKWKHQYFSRHRVKIIVQNKNVFFDARAEPICENIVANQNMLAHSCLSHLVLARVHRISFWQLAVHNYREWCNKKIHFHVHWATIFILIRLLASRRTNQKYGQIRFVVSDSAHPNNSFVNSRFCLVASEESVFRVFEKRRSWLWKHLRVIMYRVISPNSKLLLHVSTLKISKC